jgi:biopolymer transport protein TolR
MAFASSSSDRSISDINVTPLVDVMLVLLVIFMVTAPILQQGVQVNLPKVRAAPLPGDDIQLVVNVDKNGGVLLNDSRLTAPELENKLRAIIRERPDKQVFLRADQDARYGDVMRALAAVKSAGVERLGMVTEPPAERR